VIAVQEAQPPFILGNFPKAEVQFACLDPSDPEFNSPRQADGSPPRPASAPSVSTGTGFAIHNPTTLITAFHVIEGARSIEVMCAAGQHAAAIVERVDPANDLALLKLSVPAPAHLELAPENSATIGQKVFTIGFPVPGLLGTEAKYSDGAISSLSGLAGAANLLQVTVPSQPGNSGGPLADESGRLVGVVTSTAAVQGFLRRTGTLPQNINWAVRSEYVRPLLSGVPLQQAQVHSSAVERVRQSACMVRAIGT
jgi:S1-C subfamily serine protease